MAVQPLTNNPVGLFRLLPEKAVAAAFDDFISRALDMVAQMLSGDHVVAGVGVDFVFAANKAQRRRGNP